MNGSQVEITEKQWSVIVQDCIVASQWQQMTHSCEVPRQAYDEDIDKLMEISFHLWKWDPNTKRVSGPVIYHPAQMGQQVSSLGISCSFILDGL